MLGMCYRSGLAIMLCTKQFIAMSEVVLFGNDAVLWLEVHAVNTMDTHLSYSAPIDKGQAGFRKDFRTKDQVFTIRHWSSRPNTPSANCTAALWISRRLSIWYRARHSGGHLSG